MQAGASHLWDAIATKNVAKVRRLLSHHPELAMEQHPVTRQTPFSTAFHAHAIDERQDEELHDLCELFV